MFFRRKQSPSGRVLQLLESYRNLQGQPRHRVVISLGDAPLAPEDWKTVAGVLVDQVTHSQSAVLGPALLAYHAWQQLGLSAALSGLGFNPTQQALAAATVINRLVEPLSEHALAQWLAGTALPDLLGERILKGDSNRFYYVSDTLLAKQVELEAHFR